jgi:hypothetical protein
MLHGANNPTLARDTMFAVVMIALNGLVGFSLLLGGLRHHEQNWVLRFRRLLFSYYHRSRLHLSSDKDSPDSRSLQSVGRVIAFPEVVGLHHQYERVEQTFM